MLAHKIYLLLITLLPTFSHAYIPSLNSVLRNPYYLTNTIPTVCDLGLISDGGINYSIKIYKKKPGDYLVALSKESLGSSSADYILKTDAINCNQEDNWLILGLISQLHKDPQPIMRCLIMQDSSVRYNMDSINQDKMNLVNYIQQSLKGSVPPPEKKYGKLKFYHQMQSDLLINRENLKIERLNGQNYLLYSGPNVKLFFNRENLLMSQVSTSDYNIFFIANFSGNSYVLNSVSIDRINEKRGFKVQKQQCFIPRKDIVDKRLEIFFKPPRNANQSFSLMQFLSN